MDENTQRQVLLLLALVTTKLGDENGELKFNVTEAEAREPFDLGYRADKQDDGSFDITLSKQKVQEEDTSEAPRIEQ